MGEQTQLSAQSDELAASPPDRRAIVLPEVRDGLEVRRQTPGQPHQLDIATGLTLQPAARRDLVDVAVNDRSSAARPDDRLDVRSLLESHRQSPAPRDPAHRQTRRSPAPGCPQQRSHPDTREAECPVYGLHSGRSASSHPPARIIQNYNSTGVFTQPRPIADLTRVARERRDRYSAARRYIP